MHRSSHIRLFAVALIALAAGFGAATGAARAATYTASDGASLETALAKAGDHAGADTIELDGGDYAPRAPLTVRGDVTISGPTSGRAAHIDGGAVDPYPSALFTVADGARLTLERVIVTGGGGNGAPAIDDFGSIELDGATVAGNGGAGLLVEPGAKATVRNSTFSDGLDFGLVDQGDARLVNATIAGNRNGGIDAANGTLHMVNTIVAGNGLGDCTAPVTGADHSLDGDGTCGVGALSHVDPLLSRLDEFGGPTSTRALGTGSPAIDAAKQDACPAIDQRGAKRPDGRCDIGAFEAGASAPPGAVGSGTSTGQGGAKKGTRVYRTVRADGRFRRVRDGRRFWVTVRVRATVGSRRATITYRDPVSRFSFRALTLRSLKIDAAGRTATLRGTGRMSGRRSRKVTYTLVLKTRPGRGAISLRLSNRYSRSARLARGSVKVLY